MKYVLIGVLGILLFTSAPRLSAQEVTQPQRPAVLLYLKKGFVLRGHLLSYVPGGELTMIDLSYGDTLTIPDESIKGVKYVDPEGTNFSQVAAGKLSRLYEFPERGLYHATTFGITQNTTAAEAGGLTGFELTAVLGYQHHRWLGFGLGTGIDFYHRSAGEMVVPIFGEVRGYLLEQNVSPYVTLRGGYGIGLSNRDQGIEDARGGWMINPAWGLRLGGRKGMNVVLDIGLKYQKASFVYGRLSERSDVDITYKRLNMRIGFLF